jgi:hypothetical protein
VCRKGWYKIQTIKSSLPNPLPKDYLLPLPFPLPKNLSLPLQNGRKKTTPANHLSTIPELIGRTNTQTAVSKQVQSYQISHTWSRFFGFCSATESERRAMERDGGYEAHQLQGGCIIAFCRDAKTARAERPYKHKTITSPFIILFFMWQCLLPKRVKVIISIARQRLDL